MFPLLETLVAVYEVGQFTLAADELKVSQSTVSSRIAQLEQMVGAPLFVRNAKSDVTPTQAGRMLYQTAIGIDGLWRDTREQIARVQEAREPLGRVVLAHDRGDSAAEGVAGDGSGHGRFRLRCTRDELGCRFSNRPA